MPIKHWIPNALTLCGIVISAIAIVNYEYFLLALVVIPINAFIDWFDGYYARKINAVSTIGRCLDFFNDTLGFVILPMVITLPFVDASQLLFFIALAILYVGAGFFRLIREFIKPKKTTFTGLPTTSAAVIYLIVKLINISVFGEHTINTFLLFTTMIVLMILMVSHIKFCRIYQKKSC